MTQTKWLHGYCCCGTDSEQKKRGVRRVDHMLDNIGGRCGHQITSRPGWHFLRMGICIFRKLWCSEISTNWRAPYKVESIVGDKLKNEPRILAFRAAMAISLIGHGAIFTWVAFPQKKTRCHTMLGCCGWLPDALRVSWTWCYVTAMMFWEVAKVLLGSYLCGEPNQKSRPLVSMTFCIILKICQVIFMCLAHCLGKHC